MTLPAAAARARAAAIDRHICRPRPSSAANPTHVAAAIDRRDRRTRDRYVDI